MGKPPTIHTARLELIAAESCHYDAELESSSRLETLLEAGVPSDWPPGEYDRSAIEFFQSRLAEDPEASGWYTWYAVLLPSETQGRVLVGAGGYYGPPSSDGTVEIGYSVIPTFQRRGFASEIVRALLIHALSKDNVQRVIAHTYPDNPGSDKVLRKCGFILAGPGQESGTLRYTCSTPAI